MKRTCIFLFVALLSVGVAWADEGASEDEAAVPVERAPFAEVDFSGESEEGGCQVPDLTGLSEEEAKATAIAAGFSVMDSVPSR